MGITLAEFLKYSDDVEIIIPKIYADDLKNIKHKKAFVTEDLAERVKTITQQSDKIIVLPGGTGTILEIFFANESRRAQEHNCDIIVVNSDGFYDGLRAQIADMVARGFTGPKKFMVKFIDSAAQLNEKNFDVIKDLQQCNCLG